MTFFLPHPPQHLEDAVRVLDARPEVGLVHGDATYIDADGAPAGRSAGAPARRSSTTTATAGSICSW